jgi:hypothetical protein
MALIWPRYGTEPMVHMHLMLIHMKAGRQTRLVATFTGAIRKDLEAFADAVLLHPENLCTPDCMWPCLTALVRRFGWCRAVSRLECTCISTVRLLVTACSLLEITAKCPMRTLLLVPNQSILHRQPTATVQEARVPLAMKHSSNAESFASR